MCHKTSVFFLSVSLSAGTGPWIRNHTRHSKSPASSVISQSYVDPPPPPSVCLSRCLAFYFLLIFFFLHHSKQERVQENWDPLLSIIQLHVTVSITMFASLCGRCEEGGVEVKHLLSRAPHWPFWLSCFLAQCCWGFACQFPQCVLQIDWGYESLSHRRANFCLVCCVYWNWACFCAKHVSFRILQSRRKVSCVMYRPWSLV